MQDGRKRLQSMANGDILMERKDGVGSVRPIAPRVVHVKRYGLGVKLHDAVSYATALRHPDDVESGGGILRQQADLGEPRGGSLCAADGKPGTRIGGGGNRIAIGRQASTSDLSWGRGATP
jgi:hypothetical protein